MASTTKGILVDARRERRDDKRIEKEEKNVMLIFYSAKR